MIRRPPERGRPRGGKDFLPVLRTYNVDSLQSLSILARLLYDKSSIAKKKKSIELETNRSVPRHVLAASRILVRHRQNSSGTRLIRCKRHSRLAYLQSEKLSSGLQFICLRLRKQDSQVVENLEES